MIASSRTNRGWRRRTYGLLVGGRIHRAQDGLEPIEGDEHDAHEAALAVLDQRQPRQLDAVLAHLPLLGARVRENLVADYVPRLEHSHRHHCKSNSKIRPIKRMKAVGSRVSTLTNVLHFLDDVPLARDGVGQQEGVVLQPSQQRGRDPHLVFEAQVEPGQVLRLVQQVAAGLDDPVQQLRHDRLALLLVGERFDVVRHLLGHRLDDFRGDEHVAAVQRLAVGHLRQIVCDRHERRVALLHAHLQTVQPQAAALRQVGRYRLPHHALGRTAVRLLVVVVVDDIVQPIQVIDDGVGAIGLGAAPLGDAGRAARARLDVHLADAREIPKQIPGRRGAAVLRVLVVHAAAVRRRHGRLLALLRLERAAVVAHRRRDRHLVAGRRASVRLRSRITGIIVLARLGDRRHRGVLVAAAVRRRIGAIVRVGSRGRRRGRRGRGGRVLGAGGFEFRYSLPSIRIRYRVRPIIYILITTISIAIIAIARIAVVIVVSAVQRVSSCGGRRLEFALRYPRRRRVPNGRRHPHAGLRREQPRWTRPRRGRCRQRLCASGAKGEREGERESTRTRAEQKNYYVNSSVESAFEAANSVDGRAHLIHIGSAPRDICVCLGMDRRTCLCSLKRCNFVCSSISTVERCSFSPTCN